MKSANLEQVLFHRPVWLPPTAVLRLRRRSIAYTRRAGAGRKRWRSFLLNSAISSDSATRSENPKLSRPLPHPDGSRGDGRIPLSFKDGKVLTHLGLSLLEDVESVAFENVQQSMEEDMVLGFNSKMGLTSMQDFRLGKLQCERFLSSARCKRWWMTPEWGHKTNELSPETQFLLIEIQEGGPYAIFLPLIDKGVFRATLRPPKCGRFGSNELILRLESGDDSVKSMKWNSVLYVSAGWDPYQLLDRAIPNAAKLSGGALPRTAKELPSSLDVFGWCTWDAFYSTVSAKGITEGLQSLKQGGYPPKLLIIDDGWQMTDLDQAAKQLPTEGLRLPKQKETEEACTFAEVEVLAETSTHISPQTAVIVMPTLTATGAPPCLATEDEDEYDSKEEEVVAAVSFVQRIVGSIVGLLTSFCLILYEWLVDKAPPGSLSVKIFTYLANGPLQQPMLNFYAMAGDFSQRLISIKANGKFSSTVADHDKKWKRRKENLKEVISYLKNEFGVTYIYLWHGLSAYWSGVSNEQPEMAKYQSQIVKAKPTPGILEIEPSLAWNPSVVAGVGVVDDPDTLYGDMHQYLQSAGASGVKVDAQAGAGLIGTVLGGGATLAFKYHMALENSVAKHFPGNHVINCMCHSTENLYRMLNTAVARASDDFYPRDSASTTPHIASCAYNSLFLAPLVQPDWDMFQTNHPAAELHATARVVSGGAVYISDKPGNHNFSILKQLVLADGTVLRPQLPGRPTRDCLFRNILKDGKTLLKIWTVNHYSGIVGIFNLQGASWDRRMRHFRTHDAKPAILQTKVTPRDVEMFPGEDRASTGGPWKKFAAFTFRQQKLFVGDSSMCLCVELSACRSEIVSFSPVLEYFGQNVAPIGFPHLLNGSGSILSCRAKITKVRLMKLDWSHENGNAQKRSFDAQMEILGLNLSDRCVLFEVEVKGSGKFLIYSSERPLDVWIRTTSVPFDYNLEMRKLTFEVEETMTLRSVIQVLYRNKQNEI